MVIFQKLYHDGVPAPAHLLVEGVLAAGIGTFFAAWLFPGEASLLSVSLASLTAVDSLRRLLEWNRYMIVKRGGGPVPGQLRAVRPAAGAVRGHDDRLRRGGAGAER